MRAGRLRHRVAIQAVTATTAGATGQPVPTWTTLGTVWAAIEPLKGQERLDAAGVQAKLSHRVIMRHNAYPGLTSAHRLKFKGRIFEIVGPPVNVAERGIEWQVDCREVVT